METLSLRIASTLQRVFRTQLVSRRCAVSLTAEPDRPFTLPPGKFKPKQSLSQNFLSDQNYVLKIVNSFEDDSEEGKRVIELGPGPGALTRVLIHRYPKMTAIEIDQRAVAFLAHKLPQLHTIHQDVLKVDWAELAHERDGRLNLIGNLPYAITTPILFSLVDCHRAINKAVVTSQLEVGHRLTAKPRTKPYGILAVVFQLYAVPSINFNIPPSVFYPKPAVDSCLLTFDFTKQHPRLKTIDEMKLRQIVTAAFGKRRKMMRGSLKGIRNSLAEANFNIIQELLDRDGLYLSEQWATRRPEELRPEEFIDLTMELYGPRKDKYHACSDRSKVDFYRSESYWRCTKA